MTNPDRTAPKSRRLVLLTLAALAAAILYALFQFASNTANTGSDGAQSGQKLQLERYARGQMAALQSLPKPPAQPDAPFTDSKGAARTLAEFRGRVVLVNLWATWCTPCLAEMPTLAALARDLDQSSIVVLAISIDGADATAKAERFIASLAEPNLQFFQDKSSKIAFDLQAPGMPVSIIYDKSGEEVARLAGAADWSSPEARALLAGIAK